MITYKVCSDDYYNFHEDVYNGDSLKEALNEFLSELEVNENNEVHLYTCEDNVIKELTLFINS